MQVIGIELLQGRQGNLKFLLNDKGVVFFPAAMQHRDIKLPGLSYEDDYRGNALAGLITMERVEIRFHREFSGERVRSLWSELLMIPEVAQVKFGPLYYEGKVVRESP